MDCCHICSSSKTSLGYSLLVLSLDPMFSIAILDGNVMVGVDQDDKMSSGEIQHEGEGVAQKNS